MLDEDDDAHHEDSEQAPGDLSELARDHFGDLKAAEAKVVESAAVGERRDCGGEEISPELARWLCTDRVAARLVDSRGLRIYRAKVGDLHLGGAHLDFPLELRDCDLGTVDVGDARLRSLTARCRSRWPTSRARR